MPSRLEITVTPYLIDLSNAQVSVGFADVSKLVVLTDQAVVVCRYLLKPVLLVLAKV